MQRGLSTAIIFRSYQLNNIDCSQTSPPRRARWRHVNRMQCSGWDGPFTIDIMIILAHTVCWFRTIIPIWIQDKNKIIKREREYHKRLLWDWTRVANAKPKNIAFPLLLSFILTCLNHLCVIFYIVIKALIFYFLVYSSSALFHIISVFSPWHYLRALFRFYIPLPLFYVFFRPGTPVIFIHVFLIVVWAGWGVNVRPEQSERRGIRIPVYISL